MHTFWKNPRYGALEAYTQDSYLTRAAGYVGPDDPKPVRVRVENPTPDLFRSDQLWGAPAAIQMKKTFISNLRLVAQFAREPISTDAKTAIARSLALRETIDGNLDKARALADGVLLEFGPSREQDLALRDRIRDWQPNLRMIFILRLVLWKYRARLPGFELPEAIQSAQEEFDNRLAKALEVMADRAEGNESTQKQDLSKAYAQLEQAAWKGSPKTQSQFSPQIKSFLLLSRRIALLGDSLEEEI